LRRRETVSPDSGGTPHVGADDHHPEEPQTMSTATLASIQGTEKGIDPDNIPILDLGPYLAGEPGAMQRVADQLREVSETVGFYYISNHGIDEALIEEVYHQAARYHAQPLEVKMRLPINAELQGYMPMKASVVRVSEELATDNQPDQNEAIFLFRDQPQWPEDLPGFKEISLAYFTAMDDLTQKMLRVYAVALEQDPAFFAPAFQWPWSVLRYTHYPRREYAKNEYGIAPHSDTSFFTILAQNKKAGLEIKTRRGPWVDAPYVPGTLIVNSGNVLHRWTNGRFLSTPHRAYNKDSGSRYALVFFVHPDQDYRMSCIPSCKSDSNPARFPDETTREYMAWWNPRYFSHIK
jgi:isopenicillin N synthase-like dioxygenase